MSLQQRPLTVVPSECFAPVAEGSGEVVENVMLVVGSPVAESLVVGSEEQVVD